MGYFAVTLCFKNCNCKKLIIIFEDYEFECIVMLFEDFSYFLVLSEILRLSLDFHKFISCFCKKYVFFQEIIYFFWNVSIQFFFPVYEHHDIHHSGYKIFQLITSTLHLAKFRLALIPLRLATHRRLLEISFKCLQDIFKRYL